MGSEEQKKKRRERRQRNSYAKSLSDPKFRQRIKKSKRGKKPPEEEDYTEET